MVFEFRQQPLKSLYIVYDTIILLLLHVPYWVLRYSFRSLRPRPTWSFKRAFMNAVFRHYIFLSTYGAR